MESILASGTDQRIPELDLTSPYENQASYVIRREQTTTSCPLLTVSPGSVRTARFAVVDGNFLDLSTIHFSFTVANLDGAANHVLRPASAIPHCWFRRMIIKCNGSTVEDINNLSRIEEQITRFVSTNKRRNWGDAGHGWETLTDAGTDALSKTIAPGGVQTVTWRPVSSGFLQCGKYLPMMGGAAGGLTFELECADLTDACVNADNISAQWELRDLKLHVDSVQLTSEMTASYADMLINSSIIIPYQANACDLQYFASTGGNMNISLAKQYSRLATVFVSLEDAAAGGITNNAAGAHNKSMNKFYLAQASAETVASYIQVNNQRWPQFDTVGTKHQFHRLLQCLGIWNSWSHASNISAAGYGDGTADSRQFVVGFDLETIPHSEASGIPVQGGGTVQIALKNVGDPTRAYIMTHFDAALEIKSQGSIVYS